LGRAARLLESARQRWRASRLGAWTASYFAVIADRESGWPRRVGYAVAGLAALGALGVVLLLTFALALIPFTPATEELKRAKRETPSVARSADGKELASYKRLNREWVKLDKISRPVIDALIATEDHRFYEHHGIDVRRTIASVLHTLAGDLQGGSTITQQLARNLYPEQIGRSASITRKVKEIVTALKIESALTKDEILETYLNTVPFLYNAFGIEMAARTYFGKSAGTLNVQEAATLVGMLKGTSYYNPVINPERAMARRNLVLGQMAQRGKLKPGSLEALRQRPLRVAFQRQTDAIGPAPHFAEHLRKWLTGWADRNGYNIYADGLVVFTTIDSRLQALANRAVARQLEALQAVADVEWSAKPDRLMSTDIAAYAQQRQRVKPFEHFWTANSALVDSFIRESPAWRAEDAGPEEQRLARLRADDKFMSELRADKTRLQAGFLALDPRDGHVKAWVGSRDFKEDQFDHVVKAQRQPGSTFKPFVYAAALQQGMSPAASFQDRPVEIALGGGAVWRPTDADAPSGETMTLRDGLVLSKNTITAQVMQKVGAAKVATLARDMGVRQSKLQAVPSLALGTSPVTLSEMVSGYATIANGGTYIEPILVTRIEDGSGNVLEEFAATPEPVLASGLAATLFDVMRGVIDEGTGTGIRNLFGLRADVAGKTGTTQDNTDGWFILMHRQLVAGAWVGFNDNRVTMRSGYWGQGAHNALFVVGDFYRQVIAARLIEPGVARPPRQVEERRAENVIERFGNLLGRIFDRDPGPRQPSYQRGRPQLQPDEELFYDRRDFRRERRERGRRGDPDYD
jgi:penicillin-binding protein 1A